MPACRTWAAASFCAAPIAAFTALAWGDVYNHFNGDTANIVRYDSPAVAGFNVAGQLG